MSKAHIPRAFASIVVVVCIAWLGTMQATPAARTAPVGRAPAVASASPTPTPHDVTADAKTFVALINRERASHHGRRLVLRADLAAIAQRQSGRMAANEQLWHDRNAPKELTGWLSLGENVGWSRISVADLHAAFMASPEHRRNILDPAFTSIGVAETIAADGRIFVTEEFGQFAP